MDRTFNFQVDNGIFVAQYYLDKNYKDITVKDLENNIGLFSEKLYSYNSLSTLSCSSHMNSALTQKSDETRKERINKQLKLLLNNIGEDKNCIICGKKRVNTSIKLPYSSLMYGLASHDSFMNRGNNLKTVDVCPVCLFLSLVGFLNTQKISYPFVYLSDSDEFMEDITEKIQEDIEKNIMLEIKQTKLAQNFMSVMEELIDAKESGVYEGLDYISLIQYSNGKTNYYKETEISKETLDFLLRLKDAGLMVEFYKLNLFYEIQKDYNLFRKICKVKKVSVELYDMIKEEYMTKSEINLIEDLANKLKENYGAEKTLKELKLVASQRDFRELLIRYTNEIDLELTLLEIDTLVKRYREFTDYIRLAIQINKKRKNKGDM